MDILLRGAWPFRVPWPWVFHAATLKKHLSGFVGSILGLGACAVVTIFDLVDEFGAAHNGEAIYAMIVSCITIIVVAYFFYQQHTTHETGGHVAFFTFNCFAIMWIILAGLVTFRGPFALTGNGYFGAWTGAITSVYACKAAHNHD